MWTVVHHCIYTTVKIAMTYDARHHRGCSQPAILLVFISTVAIVHMSYGLSKLAHMKVIHSFYGKISDLMLFTGFACRVFCGISIAFLSAPSSPLTRGDTPLAHVYGDKWGWTHTEWHYLMIGDLCWCTGAIFLKIMIMVTPPDPPKQSNPMNQNRKVLSAEEQALVVATARDFSGRNERTAREIYASADADGDGNLDRDEIKKLLKEKYEFDISEEALDQVFAIFDKDSDGQLDFDEFEGFVSTNIIDGTLTLDFMSGGNLEKKEAKCFSLGL